MSRNSDLLPYFYYGKNRKSSLKTYEADRGYSQIMPDCGKVFPKY